MNNWKRKEKEKVRKAEKGDNTRDVREGKRRDMWRRGGSRVNNNKREETRKGDVRKAGKEDNKRDVREGKEEK